MADAGIVEVFTGIGAPENPPDPLYTHSRVYAMHCATHNRPIVPDLIEPTPEHPQIIHELFKEVSLDTMLTKPGYIIRLKKTMLEGLNKRHITDPKDASVSDADILKQLDIQPTKRSRSITLIGGALYERDPTGYIIDMILTTSLHNAHLRDHAQKKELIIISGATSGGLMKVAGYTRLVSGLRLNVIGVAAHERVWHPYSYPENQVDPKKALQDLNYDILNPACGRIVWTKNSYPPQVKTGPWLTMSDRICSLSKKISSISSEQGHTIVSGGGIGTAYELVQKISHVDKITIMHNSGRFGTALGTLLLNEDQNTLDAQQQKLIKFFTNYIPLQSLKRQNIYVHDFLKHSAHDSATILRDRLTNADNDVVNEQIARSNFIPK